MKSSNYTQLKFLVVVPIALLGLISCSEDAEVEPTFSSLWENKFNSCGNVTCHSAAASNGTELGPDLSSKSNFYNNLVNKNVAADFPDWAAVRTGSCDSVDFIEPNNANQSTVVGSLVESVSDTLAANFNCTTAYNLHVVEKVHITDSKLQDALIQWVNDGAQNN